MNHNKRQNIDYGGISILIKEIWVDNNQRQDLSEHQFFFNWQAEMALPCQSNWQSQH